MTKTVEGIPYVAFGNEEIEVAPLLGDNIVCNQCGETHEVKFGTKELEDGTKVQDKTLAYVNCSNKSYLVGINGKDIRKRFGSV